MPTYLNDIPSPPSSTEPLVGSSSDGVTPDDLPQSEAPLDIETLKEDITTAQPAQTNSSTSSSTEKSDSLPSSKPPRNREPVVIDLLFSTC